MGLVPAGSGRAHLTSPPPMSSPSQTLYPGRHDTYSGSSPPSHNTVSEALPHRVPSARVMRGRPRASRHVLLGPRSVPASAQPGVPDSADDPDTAVGVAALVEQWTQAHALLLRHVEEVTNYLEPVLGVTFSPSVKREMAQSALKYAVDLAAGLEGTAQLSRRRRIQSYHAFQLLADNPHLLALLQTLGSDQLSDQNQPPNGHSVDPASGPGDRTASSTGGRPA